MHQWLLEEKDLKAIQIFLRTNDTKVFSRGDAAFADYTISLGFGYRF